MRPVAAVITCTLVLGGCATPQQRQERLQADLVAAIEICQSVGFQRLTPEIQQCAMQVYSQQQATDAQRRANAAAIGAVLLQNSRPAAPPPSVVCRQMSVGMVCQ